MSSIALSGPLSLSSVVGSAVPGAASITSAPNPSATPTPTPSSSREPQVHTVKAGAGDFKFEPAELHNVTVGDIITFEFYPADHSVARAEYKSPCVPYEYTGKDKVGFWSETRWVDSVDELQYWNLTINSTEPIWYYCGAPGSCIDHQMVGVINPNDTQRFDVQEQLAGEAKFMVQPGEPVPKEGEATLSATGPASTSTSPPATGNGSHGVHLSGGAIAGIVVGAVAFLVVAAALFFYVGRTKSLKEMMHRKDATVTRPEEGGGDHRSTWNSSQHPGSPGFPPSPYSPPPSNSEFFTQGQLPAYGQHNATESHPSGWMSPAAPQHQSMVEVKDGQQAPSVHEMASPQANAFTAELEAPIKSPR